MSTTKSAWNTTGVQPNLEGGYDSWPGTTTYEPEGVPDPVWTAPASSYPAGTPESEYEAAMTVPVGTDPLSLGTTGALGGIYESGGQGALANQAQGLVSGLIGTGGDIGGYGPQTAAGQAGRAGLTSMILEGGLDPSDFRTELGQKVQGNLGHVINRQGQMAANPMTAQVQGALGGVIGQQGQRPAHEATQQAQQQYDALIQQGAQRPLSASEQAMLQQLEQTIASGGQLDQSTLAQTSEQTLQDIIRASASAVAGQGGTLPQSALAQHSEQALQDVIQQGGTLPQSDLGVQTGQHIADLLANQGRLPEDLQREAMQLEAARSPLDVMRRAQTAQGAAALADRGLVGSGAGREYLEGLEERLAPQYTQAAQQIAEQRRQAEDQRYSQALGLGAQRAGHVETLGQQGFQSAIGEAGRQTAQQEQLQQQILESALGQAGQQTAQQEQLEQTERLETMQQTGQYGLGHAEQGQQQQRFAISGQQQLGAQQDQAQDQRFQTAMQMGQALGLSREEMQTSRLGQAVQQAGTMSAQESNARQNRYIQSVMAGEGITEQEARAQDQRMQMAVQTATGLDAQMVQNLLNTATTTTGRQQVLGNLAAKSLDQNMHWNQFLAQFGLDRTVAQHDIQNRRLDRILPLLEVYTRTMQGLGQGYTFHDPERTGYMQDIVRNYLQTPDVTAADLDDPDKRGGTEGTMW